MIRSILAGTLWAVVGAFPLAALVALCYRFPIPFSGYESGPAAVLSALFGVVFYGTMGGFVVLAGLGAASGGIAHWLAGQNKARLRWLVPAAGLTCAFVAIMILAVLDKIVGAW
jgi:hypothetical protein